jgi:membrane-associated phospholipid phosphatase
LILGQVYCRATRGWLRGLVVVWFGLIVLSTLLVYQHHVVDLLGGAAVGLASFLLLPAQMRRVRPCFPAAQTAI